MGATKKFTVMEKTKEPQLEITLRAILVAEWDDGAGSGGRDSSSISRLSPRAPTPGSREKNAPYGSEGQARIPREEQVRWRSRSGREVGLA